MPELRFPSSIVRRLDMLLAPMRKLGPRIVSTSTTYVHALRGRLHVAGQRHHRELALLTHRSLTTSPNFRESNLATRMADDVQTASFDLTGPNKVVTKVHVRPSYPHKPKAVANLTASLPELLTDAVMPTSGVKGFSTQGWDLDESNDTIHRYVELNSQQDVTKVLNAIKDASQELNHDPHIHTEGTRLTISCTTHVPPGLSMKDVKLARKVNEILGDVEVNTAGYEDEAEILTQRQRAREQNMDTAKKAKLNCSCG